MLKDDMYNEAIGEQFGVPTVVEDIERNEWMENNILPKTDLGEDNVLGYLKMCAWVSSETSKEASAT
jgi:hypothetical protein